MTIAPHKESVRILFDNRVDEWAALYAAESPQLWSAEDVMMRRRFALEMIHESVAPGAKVLDLGCGTGDMSAELIRAGYEVWGVDISKRMIAHVRKRFGSDRFRTGDVERIDFADNTFDAVVCLGVLEYLNDDARSLAEIRRVLKPNGRAIISTPNALCLFHHSDAVIRLVRSVVRPLYRLFRQAPRSGVVAVKHRRYWKRAWFALLRESALQPEASVCHSWGWYELTSLFGQASLCRASARFAANPSLNWFANTRLVRVRALK